ncbi:MAG: DNA-directed RNA polymerase subunit H [Candidatus Thermoplasmatota archaeon]|jgi:DNA-directed RNA polymerase subunit H (RpoH/RPB5)|nr:DNA-directed RNA polymerase subunit H [Candidatus Thermoplasmatota archaeon]
MATKKKTLEDITKHELVPEHIILSDKEKKDILKKYQLEQNQFPRILDTDPVCLHIGAKPGKILKITRKSHTANKAVSYRLVVESSK